MSKYKKIILFACAFGMHRVALAQTTTSSTLSNNEGLMRSEGKIYVVMAVSLIVLTGLILYLSRLERKITKLEKGESS